MEVNLQKNEPVTSKVHHKKRLLLIIIATVLVIVSVIVACVILRDKSDALQKERDTVSSQIKANLPFEFTEPELNVDPTRKFTYTVSYDIMTLAGFDLGKGYSDAIEVFCDPSLSIKAEDAYVGYQLNGFLIKPFNDGVDSYDPISEKSVKLSKQGEWGFSDQYFIVQKLDPITGKKLVKPLVTRFTVEKKVPKPVVSFSVDDKGIGHFSWGAIEKASKYYIIKMEKGRPFSNIIGVTTKTEWTTAEQDRYVQKDLARNENIVTQNMQFKSFNFSEDDLRDKKDPILANKQKFTKNVYGIVAMVDQDASAFSVTDDSVITKRLPFAIAYNAVEEMKANVSDIKTFDEIPTERPVTMSDGSTVLRRIYIDINSIKKGEMIRADKDDAGNLSNKRTITTIKVPYHVEGTMFKGEYRIEEYNEQTYLNEVQRIATRNKEARAKTGATDAYTYSTQKKDLSKVQISKTMPKVVYKISSTNSMTEYLAANMIEGNQYIDVSKYLSDTNGITVHDAALEASAQNPYVLGVERFNYISDMKIMEVVYKVTSKEERIKEQKAIADEVDRVVGKIITSGMNDEQKVKAMNDYMTETATYDYDALDSIDHGSTQDFKHAWTPAGILLDKKAVCGGYAITFKALADKAGIEAMYVRGLANGEPHAWNKVKVYGAWRVIDVTWNDSKASPNKFYLLTDEQANKTRTQDSTFVIDILVGNYTAN